MAKILSIEDDPEMQHMIGEALFRAGYEVHYAFNGKEGYEKILSLRPDLVLLDLMLPGLSGVEIIKRVTTNAVTRAVPIIVITAFADQANTLEQSIRAHGVREYLRKPFRVDDFLGVVRRTLEKAPPPSSGPAPVSVAKGGVRLLPQFRTVWVNDVFVATLPRKRAELFRALLEAKGPIRRDKLIAAVWGAEGSVNLLEKTIQRLREDLGPGAANLIQTTADGYELVG